MKGLMFAPESLVLGVQLLITVLLLVRARVYRRRFTLAALLGYVSVWCVIWSALEYGLRADRRYEVCMGRYGLAGHFGDERSLREFLATVNDSQFKLEVGRSIASEGVLRRILSSCSRWELLPNGTGMGVPWAFDMEIEAGNLSYCEQHLLRRWFQEWAAKVEDMLRDERARGTRGHTATAEESLGAECQQSVTSFVAN